MTALVDTLFQLEKYLGLELDSLAPLAAQDDIGGYHPDPTQRKWGAGAIWEVEGQTIYALIRALKPQTIVEIGSGTGCSTTHMADALNDINIEMKNTSKIAFGHITTIDRGNTPQIPGYLSDFVTIQGGDAVEWLQQQPDNSIDFILEDADHSEAMCYQVGELAKTKLRPGGVLMVHDAVHPTVGADVRAGYDRAGLDVRTYLTDPSDCGFACWQKPVPVNSHVPEEYLQSLAAKNPYLLEDYRARIEEMANLEEQLQQLEEDVKQDTADPMVAAAEKAASLADTEPVLQAQEDEDLPFEDSILNIGGSLKQWALEEDEPAPPTKEDEDDYELPPAKKKPVRKAKPRAKK